MYTYVHNSKSYMYTYMYVYETVTFKAITVIVVYHIIMQV